MEKNKKQKKGFLITIIILLVILLGYILFNYLKFGMNKNLIKNSSEENLELIYEEDNGKEINVNVGETISIKLGKAVTPYDFIDPIYNNSILKYSYHKHFNPGNDAPAGNGGYDIFKFKAIKSGTSGISIQMSNGIEVSDRFYIKVLVN